MFTTRTLFPVIMYALAWRISAHHPVLGLIWLLLIGMGIGIYNGFPKTFANKLKVLVLSLVLALIAIVFPVFGEIFDAIVMLYGLYLKIKVVQDNMLLIIAGIVSYSLLFAAPSLNDWFQAKLSMPDASWLAFAAGGLLMLFLYYIGMKAGYESQKMGTCVVGLPGLCVLLSLPGTAIGAAN